jgi:hypothetical protein
VRWIGFRCTRRWRLLTPTLEVWCRSYLVADASFPVYGGRDGKGRHGHFCRFLSGGHGGTKRRLAAAVRRAAYLSRGHPRSKQPPLLIPLVPPPPLPMLPGLSIEKQEADNSSQGYQRRPTPRRKRS